jgi:hypothetical protein
MTDEVSMRDTLEKTLADIEERAEEEEKEEIPEKIEEPEEKPEVEEEPEAAEKPEVEAKTPEPKAAKEKAPAGDDDKSLANPPSTWTAKGKSQWGTLPPDIKREIKKREGDAAEGIRKFKESSAFGERISKAVTPYQPFLRQRGVAVEAVVENALNLAYSLSSGTAQEKGAIIRRIAQQYGADLSAAEQKPDPLDQKLAPLLNKIEMLERERLNSQTQSKQQQDSQLVQTIDSFASETDDTGSLSHPYFDNVRDLMAALLDSGSASTLKDAYALAVETHPQTRDIIRATNAQKESERKANEARERSAKLKRNNQVNFDKKPTHSSKTAVQGSMRETIESTYERAISR